MYNLQVQSSMMSSGTCGLMVTEILVAIGDSYWRCVECQLRFSKFSSIDEHIRQRHENTNDNTGFVANNVQRLASTPNIDSTFGTVSFEERETDNVSSVPSIFKVNLDNPNLKEPTKDLNQNSQRPNNSSVERVSVKSHSITTNNSEISLINPVPKFKDMGHLNCSGSDYVQPFGPNESPVISGLLNNSVNDESLTLQAPQMEQQNVNENVDDIDEDGNVSKAMLASMLSLLERGLEMDDISSVFQNVDSVSPEFFEQQLLNHSDLADNIDSSLEDLPNEGNGSNTNTLVQPQVFKSQVDKEEGNYNFKEIGIQSDSCAALDYSSVSVSKCMSHGGESNDLHVNAVSKTSSDTPVHIMSHIDTSMLGKGFEKRGAELQRDNENSEEHQAETIDYSSARVVKAKQTKLFGLMSSQNQSNSLEKISCRNKSKYSESSETLQSPILENKDKCSKIISTCSVLPQSSEGKSAQTNHSIHCSSRKGNSSTSKTILFSDHLKKRVRSQQPANCSSPKLSNCLDQPRAEKTVLSHISNYVAKLSPMTGNVENLSNHEETVALGSTNGVNNKQSTEGTRSTLNHEVTKHTVTRDLNIEISKSFVKLVKMTDRIPTANQSQLENRTRQVGQNKRLTSVSNHKCVKSKKNKVDAKDNQVDPSSPMMGSSLPEMVNATRMVMSDELFNSKFICKICDANFSSSGALQRHKKVNFALTKPCECKICHKKFHCLSVLSVHVYKCHEGLGNPMCLMCYVKCSSTRYLLQHVRMHQQTEAKRIRRREQVMSPFTRERIKSKYWRCGKCNSIIPNRNKIIKTHVCIVSKTCQQCNIEFPTVSTFKLHMASHKGRMFECSVCGEFFKNKASRDSHKLTHNGNFLCQICGRQFAHQYLLSKHAKIHSQVRKASPALTCAECNKVYKCKRSFQQHINIVHLGMEYQFQCFHCQHKFLTSNQLREHVAWQHFGEKSHPCRFCDKKFVCRPTLIRHERNQHTGVKPYKCRFCPEAFVEKKFLDIHEVKQHTLIFPYKCDVCGKGFVQASCLRSHLLTHKKHKPHQCDICGSCFSKPCHLKRHTITCLKKHLEADKKTDGKANSNVLPLTIQS